ALGLPRCSCSQTPRDDGGTSSDGGNIDGGTIDGGTTDGGTTDGGGTGTSAVTGSHPVHYLTDTGPMILPFDMSSAPPFAGVWADGGFTTYPGTALADGGFVI